MKILVHDFAAHPFQVQLSRALAARGHEVIHVAATGPRSGRGALVAMPGDAATLRLVAVEAGATGGSFVRRRSQEVAYGKRVAAVVAAERPDVVLSSNTPTESQEPISKACREHKARFYCWVQDFYSLAVTRQLRKKLPVAGALAGAYYRWLEGGQLRSAAGVVAITEEFSPILRKEFGVDRNRITTIPNWAPLDAVPVRGKRNGWSEAHGLADKFVYLYAGALGPRHNAALLLELARRHRDNDAVRVVVLSEGPGAEWLRAQAAANPLPGLVLLPPAEAAVLPEVLATGDVLVGVLDEDDGVFSVPSEILTCLCAERPILLAAPSLNRTTRMVARERVGMTCAPGDVAAFLEAADHMRTQQGLGAAMGRRARAYAEKCFRIETIADQFENVLTSPVPGRPPFPKVSATSGTKVLAA